MVRDQLGLVSKHNYLFPLLTTSHTTIYIQHVTRYYLGAGFSYFLYGGFLECLWTCKQAEGGGGMQDEHGTWIIFSSQLTLTCLGKRLQKLVKRKKSWRLMTLLLTSVLLINSHTNSFVCMTRVWCSSTYQLKMHPFVFSTWKLLCNIWVYNLNDLQGIQREKL